MGRWRLEWVRLWRTRRLIALGATFLILGFGLPILTYYLPQLVNGTSNGVRIAVPPQTALDSLQGFAGNVGQLGTLVVASVTAANLSIDAHPGIARFYRSRVHRPIRLLGPRYIIVTAASVTALALGTFAAMYETRVIFGPFSYSDLLTGLVLEAVWFCFVTAVVTAFASALRGVVGVIGASIAFLLALALFGNLPWSSSWLPTRLAGSEANLTGHAAGNIWQAILSAGAASIAALGFAVARLGKREP